VGRDGQAVKNRLSVSGLQNLGGKNGTDGRCLARRDRLKASCLNLVRVFLAVCTVGLFVGCATLPNGRGWGQDATILPGWHRVWDAAVAAALAPETWVPAAGALAFQVGDLDRNLSQWASDHTPLFGSRKSADRASDYLSNGAEAAYLITALATPSGEEPGAWALAKVKGIAVGLAAVELTDQSTDLLKSETHRTRPDGSDDRSFPSGHTSNAAVCATLASRNLDSLPLSAGSNTALRIGLASLTAGTAWTRVEAKRHFPSDVLAGAALGHFLGAFMNDAFLGLDLPYDPIITVEPSSKGVMLGLHWAF